MAGLQSYIHHLKVDVNKNTNFGVEETGFPSKFVLAPSTVLSSRQTCRRSGCRKAPVTPVLLQSANFATELFAL